MIPRWVDREAFPFVVHTLDGLDGRMAYVDEGWGRTLLFVHGNPSWSFMYRDLIKSLSAECRCVAVDLLGFGLSDKPHRADYRPEAHAARLAEFVELLGLERVTVVAHDFGGPVAFAWALDHPERVEGFVFFNTWLWSLKKNPDARMLFKNFDHWVNRFYYTQLRASPKFFLPVLVRDAMDMPKRVLNQYMYPFSEHKSRQGPYTLARHLIRSSDWFDGLWERRDELAHLPYLLLWADQDTLSGSEGLERLSRAFPDARPVRLGTTGSLAPQDCWQRSLFEIRGFLRTLGGPVLWPWFLD